MKRIQVCIGRFGRRHLRFVHRRYTYETDLNLEVGDVVQVPVGRDNELREATVASLESDWKGEIKKVWRLLERSGGRVVFCNWCPDPASPDPRHHPNKQVGHVP